MFINKVVQSLASTYAKTSTATNKMESSSLVKNLQKIDEIVLSKEARTFSATLKNIKAKLEDVRSEKVTHYKEQIEKGTYNIPSEQIATKIIDMRF